MINNTNINKLKNYINGEIENFRKLNKLDKLITNFDNQKEIVGKYTKSAK